TPLGLDAGMVSVGGCISDPLDDAARPHYYNGFDARTGSQPEQEACVACREITPSCRHVPDLPPRARGRGRRQSGASADRHPVPLPAPQIEADPMPTHGWAVE